MRSSIKGNRIFWLVCVVVMSLLFVGCNQTDTSSQNNGNENGTGDSDPIKIGIVGAFQLAAGKEIEDAAKLAIAEINESGGIAGRTIEAYYYDTMADPQEGRAVVERLLYRDNVDFIIGEHRSEVALAILPVVMEAEKLYFNAGSASPQITAKVAEDYDFYKYTFSPMLNSNQLSEGFLSQLQEMVEENDYERVALIAETAVWVDPIVEMFEEQFGDKVVLIERPSTDTEDFSIELSRLQESQADVAMTLFSANQGIIFARQWADREIPVMITGYNVQGQSGEFWNQTEGKAHGLLTWKHGVQAEITNMTIPFWDNFTDTYGRIPGPYTGLTTYDAVHILAQAIEQAGTTDADALVETLENGTFKGAGGVIHFDENHGIKVGEEFVPFTYIQWQDGEMQTVWPQSVATGEVVKPDWLND